MKIDDFISRQAAIDVAMNDNLILLNMDSVKDGDIHRTKRSISRLLASLPSVQPEIIRCKECAIRFTSCPMVVRSGVVGVDRLYTEDDDYCSCGVAKGG